MDQPSRYIIRFDSLATADASRAAQSLRRSLQEVDPTIQAKQARADEEAMDLGTSLVVILATPAVITLAKGLSNWLARAHTSKLTIIGPDGKIVVENLTARDTANLAEKLQAAHGRR